MGSRSTVIGGTALWMAADKLIAKGKIIAAHLLEAAEADIAFADGRYTVAGTDRSLGIKEVARAAFQTARLPKGLEAGFYETGTFSPASDTYPNGCHVCEVEVDPETGSVELVKYVVADDVGTVINPLTLKGQIHGGVAQGVGQILMERVAYDPESGQLLSASFMDYAMPRATDMCNIAVTSNPVPTRLNPLGAKGAGEGGIISAGGIMANAVANALSAFGVQPRELPLTPPKIWEMLQAGRR
jgi:carbon-monoxide dehydrogenase large subunit